MDVSRLAKEVDSVCAKFETSFKRMAALLTELKLDKIEKLEKNHPKLKTILGIICCPVVY